MCPVDTNSVGDNDWFEATIDSSSLRVAMRLLRATVVEPWESVDQVISEHGQAELGDPLREGTAAWHLRHIVEIFRVHARTVMVGLGDVRAAEMMAGSEAQALLQLPSNVGWSPRMMRDGLLADIDRFALWLMRQPEEVLARPFSYGSSTDLTRMLSVMLQHITWHAAAVHYWCRWKRG